MNYLFHIVVMLAVYAILAQALNLIMGYGGMLSLCQAAFFGLGAYASALLTMHAGWPFEVATVGAMILTALLAYLLSFPAARFRGDFFVLVTLAFQMIIYVVFQNWTSLTGGPYGLSGIPKPYIYGVHITTPLAFAVVAVAAAAVVTLVIWRLARAPFGRTLQAVREDEIAALSLGKPVQLFKRRAFVIAAAASALAGAIFAPYATYIDATVFDTEESIFIFASLVVGGGASIRGPFLGAAVLVLLPELLRAIGLPDAIAANLRQVIFGLLLIVLMRFRPQGIGGRYAYD